MAVFVKCRYRILHFVWAKCWFLFFYFIYNLYIYKYIWAHTFEKYNKKPVGFEGMQAAEIIDSIKIPFDSLKWSQEVYVGLFLYSHSFSAFSFFIHFLILYPISHFLPAFLFFIRLSHSLNYPPSPILWLSSSYNTKILFFYSE